MNKPAPDRATLFDKKNKNHDGKLSLEEFLAGQTDQEAAKGRFEKWDANKDDFLSREEFINMGGKSKRTCHKKSSRSIGEHFKKSKFREMKTKVPD